MNTELHYLHQVLGVQNFVRTGLAGRETSVTDLPMTTAPSASTTASVVNVVLDGAHLASPAEVKNTSQFFVYTPFVLSAGESELVKKMLNSIDIQQAEYIQQSEIAVSFETGEKNQQNIANNKGEPSNYGLCFGLKPPTQIQALWLELPAISHFLNDSDKSKQTELKKRAWAQLKDFKSKMRE